MAIYCWGNTSHGELGLGGIEDELIFTPREMPWSFASHLKQAACGSTHTLLLTSQGEVYSCGNNDYGQLGHELSRKRPQPVQNLQNYFITQVACGTDHSLALNEWGQIFSWGSDTQGQLGHDNGLPSQSTPKIIKFLSTSNVIQISSGKYHSLALTNKGDIYTWGSNSHGQIGNGVTSPKVTRPYLISSLYGLPLAYIACGGYHNFVLSKSGAVYGWGKNTFGQLGINDENSKHHPTQLKTLRNLKVRYISCGEDFSVFLTSDGGVFTCGAGQFGQLGHGSLSNEILPRKVLELMGSTITQISCGNRHTLALVSSRGRVYGFGLGSSGQLGNRTATNSNLPQVVLGPWVSPSGTPLFEKQNDSQTGIEAAVTVIKIFSGGDHCLVSTAEFLKKTPAYDCRQYPKESQILHLTTKMAEECANAEKDISVDLDLITNIESIFVSQACINASFLMPDMNHFCCSSKLHGIDIPTVIEAFEYIRKIENESLRQIIWDSIIFTLLSALKPSPPDVETLRVYLILPMYHEFVNPKNCYVLQTPFSEAVNRLTENARNVLFKWWGLVPTNYFEILIDIYKAVILYIINFKFKAETESGKKKITFESNLQAALNMLVFLYHVNRIRTSEKKIPSKYFHIPEVTDEVDIQNDYIRWIFDKTQSSFYLCKYPFLFDAKAKLSILETDQAVQMHTAMQNAAAEVFAFLSFTIVPPENTQFLYLNVSRENLVQDTLREMAHFTPTDLKKPLKVKFHGEEAEDAGGVRKEFFMLLLKEIIDPKYGMFKEYEETRCIWFSDCSFEADNMYLLIGILCGLAIYNFTIINLPFPLALYKKLLQEPVTLSDLHHLSPTMANSLQNILDYTENDLEDVFNINFEITRDIFGEIKVFPLKPDGENTPVTQENKEEFVKLYVDFIFNKSVETQYKEFHTGFIKVCGGPVLSLFEAEELMNVVIGNEDYDWHALESEAVYKNGYSSGDQTIRWFWEVFHELPLKEKKKFLLFLTGSDRIPIKGMKGMKILIQPTNDEKNLPVAHTCFNLLDLPRYQTKERLKYKLLQAIQQTHGFSLV